MFLGNFIEEELDFLEFISVIIPDFIKFINIFLSYFGSSTVAFLFIILIYWAIDKDKGYFLGNSLMLTTFVGTFFKGILKEARPYEEKGYEFLNYNAKLNGTGNTYSNPSLHSVTSTCFYSSLSYQFKKKWITIASIVIMVIVPLSRMIVGVHYPHNIFFGLFIGFIGFLLFNFVVKKFNNNSPLALLIISIGLMIIACCLNTKDSIEAAFMLFGLNLGRMVDDMTLNFKVDGSKKVKVIRVVFGFLACLIFKVLFELFIKIFTPEIPNILKGIEYLIIGFGGTYIYPLVFTKLEPKLINKFEVLKNDR